MHALYVHICVNCDVRHVGREGGLTNNLPSACGEEGKMKRITHAFRPCYPAATTISYYPIHTLSPLFAIDALPAHGPESTDFPVWGERCPNVNKRTVFFGGGNLVEKVRRV